MLDSITLLGYLVLLAALAGFARMAVNSHRRTKQAAINARLRADIERRHIDGQRERILPATRRFDRPGFDWTADEL